ncbi:tyrosine-type recombinase/integrase [Nocardia terpenica]|uniref:tyrosine-type recombinase/integrase n=1 Tax=Nocardia terpenica TaxID=455432 RepID=UPI002B4B0848|nr:tyrosine-type recombinase/integrase [Nocardia terpenica]
MTTCVQCADPHGHIIGHGDNPNRARAKSYVPATAVRDDYTADGVIRAVSANMISAFYACLLDQFSPVQHLTEREQILVHLTGTTAGAALHSGGTRKTLRRACSRAGLDPRLVPHSFRRKAAAALYAEADFNAELVAQKLSWANLAMVTDVYGEVGQSEPAQQIMTIRTLRCFRPTVRLQLLQELTDLHDDCPGWVDHPIRRKGRPVASNRPTRATTRDRALLQLVFDHGAEP